MLVGGGADMRRRVSISILVLSFPVLLVACGGGDGNGGDGDGTDLPAPPEGKATVGGKLTLNGEPLANESVELQVNVKARAKAKTDADGQFILTGVDPDSYVLSASPEVEKGPASELQGGGTQLSCEAPGFLQPGEAEGGFVIGPSTITTGGGTRYVTIWSLESKEFQVEAGDRLEKDIAYTCE
jgi:hypothetical protein